MNAGEAFGPCSAEKLGKDGFRLIVEGMRGSDCIERHCVGRTFGHELLEPRVAQAARGFFDGFGVGLGFGSGVDVRVMEGNVEPLRESFREGEVGTCFVAPQTVVQMGGVQHQAQFPAPLGESAKEGDGICTAG